MPEGQTIAVFFPASGGDTISREGLCDVMDLQILQDGMIPGIGRKTFHHPVDVTYIVDVPVHIEVALPDPEDLFVVVSIETGQLSEAMGQGVFLLHVGEPFGYVRNAAQGEARPDVDQEPSRDGFSEDAVLLSHDAEISQGKRTAGPGRPGLHPDRFSPFRKDMNPEGQAGEDPGDIPGDQMKDGDPEGVGVIRRRLLQVIAEGPDGELSPGIHLIGPDGMVLRPDPR